MLDFLDMDGGRGVEAEFFRIVLEGEIVLDRVLTDRPVERVTQVGDERRQCFEGAEPVDVGLSGHEFKKG